MNDNVISEVLDDMDDLDLNDAQKRLFADKVSRCFCGLSIRYHPFHIFSLKLAYKILFLP